MAVLKCKMCGGTLEINDNETVAICEYCGTKQTVPKLDDEKKITLFSRANRLRSACEFDKAFGVYESIVTEFSEEAEAYWGLVLCKYGIEYVDDPKTGKKIPTCHRSSFDSVFEDANFDMVMEYSDAISRGVYREEAKAIETLRTGIIEVSSKEEPYDIFICYKETDEIGDRTIDSVIAQDVYDALIEKGYKVFFSRITLEDKLGQEYEPYIFAALNSAKIMLAFGTDYEYYNAVWVKNEWSRFLSLIEKGEKKTLIPCYKDIDAYDMPAEFKRLQAQDMGKVGAIQDLLRGIEKIIGGKNAVQVQINNVAIGNNEGLLQRGMMYLEDGMFDTAIEYFDRVLDENPTNSKAYLGKFLGQAKLHSISELEENIVVDFENSNDFKRALQFATPEEAVALKKLAENNAEKIKQAELQAIYDEAISEKNEKRYANAEDLFISILGFKDAETQAKDCREKIETVRKTKTHYDALQLINTNEIERMEQGIEMLKTISGWKDVDEKISEYQKTVDELKAEEERQRIEKERLEAEIKAKRERAVIKGIIDTSLNKTVGLKVEGTVVETDSSHNGCNSWNNIIAISEGNLHTVGLKADGTVVATGDNSYGACNVRNWDHIVAVSAGCNQTVGLKSDGTVVSTEMNSFKHNINKWDSIVAISARDHTIVGLRENGTVVAAGDNNAGECNVSGWKDIIAVEAVLDLTVGLKSDGTVVMAGFTNNEKLDVSKWKDIIDISATCHNIFGLKSNGTVVSVGDNQYGQRNVRDWTDIVAISAENNHVVGIKSDGTVIAVGDNSNGQCDVSGWKLFDDIKTLKDERKSHFEKQSKWRSEDRCQHCGGELKGILLKKCVNCGKMKDY